ncbi:hypothetical protein SAMN02745148_00075 [Modicisalibacter ilicicola DSM 19980]|uniref:Uncharacterized protein n=1 Tax=Modicisalibacter ilicicola DSM 19980 TaxID=1121942 RepID=A0A1M4SDA3_9GAMM|nr:DUF6544 family protein [Halomonas ilicicola]SHE30190.1 hypothetical protein SAMN02745148_00075 [Halomonas ilicicola DSM 19980]
MTALQIVLVPVTVAASALVAVATFGALRWQAATRRLESRIDAARVPARPEAVDFGELEGLPAPVRRYFHTVLEEGLPMVAGVRARHRGSFNMGATADRWRPFTSAQRVITCRPGFVWNGRIAAIPGLPVRVHDAYVAGQGILQGNLLGLFPVVSQRGKGAIAEGELMRFLAEAVWYPTALLPSQGVHWEEEGTRSAKATLTDGAISLTLSFDFNEEGVIDTVRAKARGRSVGEQSVPTPWQGRFWNYQRRKGMLVPLEGEVAWLSEEGARPYWRGRITKIDYEFAG